MRRSVTTLLTYQDLSDVYYIILFLLLTSYLRSYWKLMMKKIDDDW